MLNTEITINVKDAELKLVAEQFNNFVHPTVVALIPAASGKGFNALIVQDVDTSKSNSSENEEEAKKNVFAKLARNASWAINNGPSMYLARIFHYFEKVAVGDTFPEYKVIVVETTDKQFLLDSGALETGISLKLNKAKEVQTLKGEQIYRANFLMPVDAEVDHILVTPDKVKSMTEKIEEAANKTVTA